MARLSRRIPLQVLYYDIQGLHDGLSYCACADATTWSVEETAEWLKSVGFDDYVTTRFIGESITCILPGSELLYVFLLSTDEEIDGDCLLAMANEERLEKIRIAKMTTRLKLVKNIKSLQKEGNKC